MNGERFHPEESAALPEPDYDPWQQRDMIEAAGDDNTLLGLHTDRLALEARLSRTLAEHEQDPSTDAAEEAWWLLKAKRHQIDEYHQKLHNTKA
jgi:hypothetical protein